MATSLQTQPYDTATANFKLWTGFIRGLFLTTGGWTASTDTGQTNPTTVGSAPGNGSWVYEIYKASDSLAGTSPVFVKVEYGQSGSLPSIVMTIGAGSSGTGVITGGGTRMGTNLTTPAASATLGGTTFDCVGSADSGSVRFIMWRNYAGSNAAQVPCCFAIERAKDNTGAAIGDFFTLFVAGTNVDCASFNTVMNFRQQTILSGGSAGNVEVSWLGVQSGLATAGLGSNVAGGPVLHMPGYVGCVSLDLLIGKSVDWGEASSNTIQHYGSNHTFYFTKAGNLAQAGASYVAQVGASGFTSVVNNGILMRYE